MKIVYFVHAIASCWNKGNAHFLRGIGTELQIRGHEVLFYEPQNGWSETNLFADHGACALKGFERAYPGLRRAKYDPANPDFDRLTDGADLIIAHEWNEPSLINALGRMRKRGVPFVLLFHDTHHRAVTQPSPWPPISLATMTACSPSVKFWPNCITAAAGQNGSSPGTKRPTRALGYSPSVRLFEAAACGVPIISDAWCGLETIFVPGREILLADTTEDVLLHLRNTSDQRRNEIAAAARARVLKEHSSTHRARELESIFGVTARKVARTA